MRFEIAVATILAAEKFASSGVAAERNLSDVQERANLRKEAIDAISQRFPMAQRRSLSEGRQTKNLQDRLRDISVKRIRKLKYDVQKKEQINRDQRNLDGDALDIGIFPKETPRSRERKNNFLSTRQKLQSKKKTTISSPIQDNFKDSAPNNQVEKSKDLLIKEVMNVLNSDKESSSGSSLPDLGIFKEEKKGDRRLQFDGDFDADKVSTAPIGYMLNRLCMQIDPSFCDACRVAYNDPLDPAAGYSVYLDCDTPAGYEDNNQYLKTQFNELCYNDLCNGGCDIAPNRFKVEMKDCSVTNIPGVSEYLPDILPEDGALTDLAPNTTHPLATTIEGFCDSIDTFEKLYASEYCTACDVNVLDKIGEITPYNVVLNCPTIPQESPLDPSGLELQNFCDIGICETCNFQESSSNFELRNCSLAATGFDSIGELLYADYGDMYSDFTGSEGADQLGEIIEGYFANVCDSDKIICGKCGPSQDSDSILSFEFDCPAVLSLPDGGFGSYFASAASFCALQSYYGIKCGVCDVNPFEATFKIDDCVVLTMEDQAKGNVANGLSNEMAFTLMYDQYCRPEIIYLQDTLNAPSCTCKFDSTTKTASLSCLHSEKCEQFPSYCDEPLQLCDTYQFSASLTQSGPTTFQRCYNASFTNGYSDPDPYQFHYCVSYGATGDSDIGTEKKNYCEMEVQGLRCNSCFLDVDVAKAAAQGHDPRGILAATTAVSSNVYDCGNTVLGTTGSFSFYDYQLLDNTLAFFSYQSLPCLGGCDLCGDGKGQFMSNPDGKFSTELWKDNTEDTCFAAQLDALTLKEPLSDQQCQDIRDVVREPCGCTDLKSGAQSFGKFFSSTIALTIAAASVAQMFLG